MKKLLEWSSIQWSLALKLRNVTQVFPIAQAASSAWAPVVRINSSFLKKKKKNYRILAILWCCCCWFVFLTCWLGESLLYDVSKAD